MPQLRKQAFVKQKPPPGLKPDDEMPQLRKQAFVKQKPPPGLKPDDEVFHCTITNEIFTDYEKFFERIILCNSMVWNCSITGRSGLTYQEALDFEAKARKTLASFPDYLQKPILYLASVAHKSRLNDLNDDVFTFTKDHFFVNEVVEAVISGEKKTCRVIKVIAPKSAVLGNDNADSDSDVICLDDEEEPKPSISDKPKDSPPESDDYQYVVQEIKKPNIFIVEPSQISRKKGLYTREKSKLYLKQHCDPTGDGIWKVKERFKKKFLTDLQWDSLFDGPVPKFTVQQAKKKPSKPKKTSGSCIDLTGEDDRIKEAKKHKKMKKMLEKEAKKKSKKAMKEVKQEAEAKLKEVEGSILSALSSPSTASEIDISDLDSPSCEQLAIFIQSLNPVKMCPKIKHFTSEDPLRDMKTIPKIMLTSKENKATKKENDSIAKALKLGKLLEPVIPKPFTATTVTEEEGECVDMGQQATDTDNRPEESAVASTSSASASVSYGNPLEALSPVSKHLVSFVQKLNTEEVKKLKEDLKGHNQSLKQQQLQKARELRQLEKQQKHLEEIEARKKAREVERQLKVETEQVAKAAKLGKELATVIIFDTESESSQEQPTSTAPSPAFQALSPTTRLLAERIKQLTPEELKKLKEELKEKKRIEREKLREEMKAIKEQERQRKNEERAKERNKKQEEKRQQEEELKTWSKPRDDMECDDLKPLPKPTPVQTKIPTELFGSVMAVLEFLEFIEALFDLEQGFPEGLSLESLSDSLQSTEPDGLYTDLVRFLLTAIFSLQDEEDEAEELEDEQEVKMDQLKTDSSFKILVEQATVAAQIPTLTFGSTLSGLHVDSFTLTEVLRLHFLASGAKGSETNVRFRYQQRGGYTSFDDAGLEFRRKEVAVLQSLGESSVYDLDTGAKLRIVEALIQQLLTFVATRDLLEDNYEKLRQAKSDLRSHQSLKNQREREETTFWYRRRMEEKAKEKELEAQRKEQKKKEKEERLRLEEQGLSVPPPAEKKEEETEDKPKEEDSGVKSMDSSPTQEKHEDVRKSSRSKGRDQKQVENKEWPSLDSIEWDKITPEDKLAYNNHYHKKELDMHETISQLQHGNAIYPLGRDRTFRRYWVFRSVAGLFVEDQEVFIPDDYLQVVPQVKPGEEIISKTDAMDEKSTSSDKENDSFDHGNSINANAANTNVLTESNLGSGDAKLDDKIDEIKSSVVCESVHEQIENRNQVCWSYYSRAEDIDALIDSLNPRGYREGPLKQALIEHRARIVDKMDDVPVDALSVSQKDLNSEKGVQAIKMKKRKGQMKGGCAEEFLELNLRETLLDIEERIFVGGLGALKVADRVRWREALEEGSYQQGQEELWWSGKTAGVGASPVKPLHNGNRNEEAMDTDDDDTSPVVRDLSKALLQVKQMVEPRYMIPPLGEDDKTRDRKQKEALELAFKGLTPRKIRAKVWDKKAKDKKTKKDDESSEEEDDDDNESDAGPKKTVEERWEESLMSATSLSQIFLHLSVLENAVEWTKSALNARCRTCRRKGQEEKMLLCDGCDKGYHMFCLKPPVKHVPKSDWFCPDCKPKAVSKTPRKRRKSFLEVQEENETEAEETADSDAEDEDEDNSSDDSDDSDSDDSDDEEDSDSEDDVEKTPPPAKIKFGPKKKQKKVVEEEEEEEETKSSSKSNSRAGSRRGSRANTPKRETATKSRQSLEKAVLEKATIAKAKKTAATKAPAAKKGRHSIETATPSVKKSNNRTSRRSLPEAGNKQAPKRKIEDQQKEGPSAKKSNTSSRRSNDHMKTCEDFLTEIMDKDEAWPFLTPVSKRDAPDYFDIVKKPVDLGSIRTQMKKFEYASPGDALRDIRLTFANCQQYNMPQTAEYKAGQKLARYFEKRVKELELESYLKTTPTKKQQQQSPSATKKQQQSPSATKKQQPSPSARRSGRRT